MTRHTPSNDPAHFPEGILRDVELAPFTTLGVGGPTRYFVEARDVASVSRALEWAEHRDLPLYVLGGGSNVVVADEGFPGLVLRVAIPGLRTENAGEAVRVEVGAGESWDRFVARAVEEGWAGIECLSGIPGLVGATPIQNVGAYGQEVSETLEAVEAIDRSTGGIVRIAAGECGFAYRSSRFKEEPDRFVVTRVRYLLTPGGGPALRYEGLREAVGRVDPGLAEVREAVLATRRAKGMVIDPDDPDTRSDGSFFVNPVLSSERFQRLLERTGGSDPPQFPVAGGTKVPAAWLIERAGFSKGDRWKGAAISSKHALALVNRDGAEARDVRELATRIRDRVLERFGVELVPEPRFLGPPGEELLLGDRADIETQETGGR